MKIKGTTIIVTGASRGIGAASAIALAKAGAKQLILLARSEEDLKKVGQQVEKSGSKAAIFPVDLSDLEAVKTCISKIQEAHATPDIIFNNAGAGLYHYVEETEYEEALFDVKLPYLAAFWITKGFMKGMLEKGKGYIVNMNSPAWVVQWPGATAYIAARAALHGFSEALRNDLRETGIRVLELTGGKTSSNYFDANPGAKERLPKIAKLIPILTPENVARHLVSGIKANRSRKVFPLMLWLFYVLNGIAPWMVRAFTNWTGHKR